ncbi:hypothetical protein FS749_010990 [Ceratobasidium sp. UAMH 11750]|nr:hypothetical protein FS749_010990 [Ceratobasidium sp. UAMH 11750]
MQDIHTWSDFEESDTGLGPEINISINPDDWDNRESIPKSLEPGQVWIRRHPVCDIPSGFQTSTPGQHHSNSSLQSSTKPGQPPYHPFATQFDFDQADILIKRGASDGHITEQLELNARRFGTGAEHKLGAPENARELHELLSHMAHTEAFKFDTREIISEFKGITFNHEVRFRCLWTALKEIVQDIDLRNHLVLLPEQRFVHSRCSSQLTLALEESWHGREWWDAQSRVGPGGRILYLHMYMDATHLSTGGGAKLWPVYVWLGNVPAELRKKHGKGGATLIGHLPVVKDDKRLDSSSMAKLRAHVYQESLSQIFKSIESAIAVGKLARCSDGKIYQFFPLLAAISADYEEL